MKLSQLGDGHDGAVWDCAISWNGSFFVTASRDTNLKLWDAETGKDVTMLKGHNGEVQACAVAPNGRFVVSGGDDGRVILWVLGGMTLPAGVELAEGRPDLILSDMIDVGHHDGPVLGCGISPDARLVASCGEDQTIKLWDPQAGRQIGTLHGHEGPIFDCVVSASGKNIVSASVDATVRLWNVAQQASQATFRGHSEIATSCSMSADLRFIVSTSVDGTVVLFDEAENALSLLGQHDGPVLACAFSPDARFAATAGADTTLRFWDLTTREQMASVALSSGLQCVALHPTRPLAVCGDHAGNVHVIDLVGMEYGPPVITAIDAPDSPGDPVILCPSCGVVMPESNRLLGTTSSCPGCGIRLRINPFVASTPISESSVDTMFLAESPPKKKRWFGRR
jgi:WD40 repeat protein